MSIHKFLNNPSKNLRNYRKVKISLGIAGIKVLLYLAKFGIQF